MGIYRHFISDFSKVIKPLCNLLVKNMAFKFDKQCIEVFQFLRTALISAPIIVAPNWDLPFKFMCNASDYANGAILGQHKAEVFHAIYYASRTLTNAQMNYATTKKKLLAMVFALINSGRT